MPYCCCFQAWVLIESIVLRAISPELRRLLITSNNLMVEFKILVPESIAS